MKPEQQIKEMGMTTALMEADMLNLINKNKELLAALEEAQQRVEIAERMVGAVEKLASDKHQELAEAQQTIARQRKSMELAQSFLQKHGGKFEPGAAEFILNGALEGETQP